jgi:hypothetical protein
MNGKSASWIAGATLMVIGLGWAATTSGDVGNWSAPDRGASRDAEGWAFHPSLAAATDGSVYAAWSQHRKPAVWELVGIYVSRWVAGQWTAVGGRIGHARAPEDAGAKWAHAYAPSLAVVGTVPYVAWYEGGGYGWGSIRKTHFGSSVFVARWDGMAWTLLGNAEQLNGALNTSAGHKQLGLMPSARDPKLAVVGSELYAAWIESRILESTPAYNVIVVKRLAGDRWVQAGHEISTGTGADKSAIVDLAMADVAGSPWIAWSEFKYRRGAAPATLQVVKLTADGWRAVGRPLNTSAEGYATHVSLAMAGGQPHVAWLERAVADNNKIYVKYWDGTRWAPAGGPLNIDPAKGDAGRPALAGDNERLWLAWAEGRPGERAKLYVRSLERSTWSQPTGPMNVDPMLGAPDSPSMSVARGKPFLAWAEKGPLPSTKQLYVRRRE